jgi:hypothetical protein
MTDGKTSEIKTSVFVQKKNVTGPDLFSELDDEWIEASMSNQLFNDLQDSDRDFVAKVTAESLRYMAENIDLWLNHSLLLKDSGDKLSIKVDILVTDILSEREAVDFYNKKKIASSVEESRSIDRDFDEAVSSGD